MSGEKCTAAMTEEELLSVRLSFMQMLRNTGSLYAMILFVLEISLLFVEISVFRVFVSFFKGSVIIHTFLEDT